MQKRILIVEDEFISALALKTHLEEGNPYTCTIAGSGEEAIEETYQNRFDLIILDIGLPGGLDGIEAARQILIRQKIPLIFISGYSDIEAKGRANSLHPVGFLSKPLNEDLLLKEVNRACKTD